MNILEISVFYRAGVACFVQDGALVAGAQQERFPRSAALAAATGPFIDAVL